MCATLPGYLGVPGAVDWICARTIHVETSSVSKPAPDAATLPHGIRNAFLFAVFNALSFQVVLSSPMVLYAKTLGASATVLGLLVGMMPLLVIFQIPAAQYVSRVGYKRFVYAGWGARVSFIFVLALVPITHSFLNPTTQLVLLLAALFGFNLSRGISSAAWLPWIASLVPSEVRGRYLASDAACVNLASFLSFLLAAFCLGASPRPWQFSALFAFSAVMGATSLVFLKKIPEVDTPEEARASNTPVPWREISRYGPFRKLVAMVIAWSMAYGGMGAFTVAFLKTEVRMPEGMILMVTSLAFLGGLCSLWFIGARLDSLGSKPVLIFAIATWSSVSVGWCLVAGDVLRPNLSLILILQFLMGLFAALVGMANTRLAMAIIPAMGRNHFFALFSVLGSVSLGLAPILWGLILDAIGPWHAAGLGLDWNRYTIFFTAVAAVFGGALVLAVRLDEPTAASMEDLLREILIQTPQRAWVRLWPRE
jgi:MFS family permease